LLKKPILEKMILKKNTKLSNIRTIVINARTSSIVADFDLWEAGKESTIRSQARNKLKAIEDMFECFSMSSVALKKFWAADEVKSEVKTIDDTKSEDVVVVDDNIENATAEEKVPESINVAAVENFVAQAAIAARLSSCKHLDPSDVSGWDYSYDAWLVLAIATIGYPEGKRKQQVLQTRWDEYLKTKFASNEMQVEKVESSVEEKSEEITGNVSCGLGGFASDLMVGKFPVKRCKEIGLALRGGSEQAAAAAAKEAAKEAAAAARASAAKEKAVAKAAKALAALPKQIFAAMQRIGRPRTGYEELLNTLSVGSNDNDAVMEVDGNDVPMGILPGSSGRYKFVLTWEMLAKESNMTILEDGTYDFDTLKKIVSSIVETAYTPTDPTSANQEVIAEGHPLKGSSLTPKTLLNAMDKIDYIHQLRLSCACLDTEGIRTGIAATCKQAGPSVGPARRDTTLPVWWTIEHDINLMRICFTSDCGYGQWKKMSANKLVADPPAEFVMPAKLAGFEWVTALTPKICEKRLQAIASGLTRHMASLPKEAVGYVPSGPGSPVRAKATTGKSKKSSSTINSSTNSGSAPLVTKMENYQRPSWINAFSAVSKPKATETTTSFTGAALLRNMSSDSVEGTSTTPVESDDVIKTAASLDASVKTATPSSTDSVGSVPKTEPSAAGMTMVPLVSAASPVPSSEEKVKVSKKDKVSPVKKVSASPVKKSVPTWMKSDSKIGSPKKLSIETTSSVSGPAAVTEEKLPKVTTTKVRPLSEAFSDNNVIVLDDATPNKATSEDHIQKLETTAVTPMVGASPNKDDTKTLSGEKRKAVDENEATMTDGIDKKAKKTKKEPKAKKDKPVSKPLGASIMSFFGGAPKPPTTEQPLAQ
jgi:hypothetical protein